jgi:pimeloyl-ACP methyl ester carboxylesterase
VIIIVYISALPTGGKFHVVAHDQGARVSWHAIARGAGRSRFLSFASFSIPHSDVFSNALFGPNTNEKQQASAQYVRMLVLPNSTTVDEAQIYHKVCVPGGWPSVLDCQRTLWWYNGAISSGAMALSPDMPYVSYVYCIVVMTEIQSEYSSIMCYAGTE